MNNRAVILLSGGLDSATVLAIAKSQGYEIYALSFDYGQRHKIELEVAKDIAKNAHVTRHEIISLDFGKFGGSSLTDTNQALNISGVQDGIPTSYVPARNTIMLSIALGFAEIVKANTIFIGVNAVDYSGYPDCRPEYIAAFETLANLATKTGVEGHKLTIQTPIIDKTKAEIIKIGMKLGVDYSKTISCYQANIKGEACGVCDSCRIRKTGFAEADVIDPTIYSESTLNN